MGAGKSSQSKAVKECSEIQKSLKRETNIDEILANHPNIEKMTFTKARLSFLEYIVYVQNVQLFESCVESQNIGDKLLTTQSKTGNKLIHTAIDIHNVYVVNRLLQLSNGDEANSK
jgi:hypothetical protein